VEDLVAYAKLALVVLGFFSLIALANLVYYRHFMRHGWRPFARPDTPRPRYTFPSGHSATFKGGSLIGFHNSSYPFATLELDEHWASVTTRFTVDVWIDRSSVTEVAAVPGGIMFRSAEGTYDGMAFWCSSKLVLPAFTHFGWPVQAADRTPR
jgi:hypothetical protein